MPAILAFSKLIFDNNVFVWLRSRLRSLYTLSNRSKTSNGSSRRKAFPSSNKDSTEFEPYIQLVDGGASATRTHTHHLPHTEKK